MPNKLILTSLRNAIESLREALAQPKNDFIRDATIQRFEYTYELAWKTIKRHLDWSGYSNTTGMPRKELLREAAKIGLIEDPEDWFNFNRARNESSHTYNQKIADEVYNIAVRFSPAVEVLLSNLSKYHD